MAASVFSVILESNHAYICHTYEEALSTLRRFDQMWRSTSIKRHVNRDEADSYLHGRARIVIHERMIERDPAPSAHRALTPLQRACAAAKPVQPDESAQTLPSSLLMDVHIKRFPRFDIVLLDNRNTCFASASDLIVRKEWRNVSVRRIQIACVLIEALESDFGKMATIVRSPSRDLSTCMHRFIHSWRKNQGRNARNQEVVGFAILDALKKLIDARKLSLFSPIDPDQQLPRPDQQLPRPELERDSQSAPGMDEEL